MINCTKQVIIIIRCRINYGNSFFGRKSQVIVRARLSSVLSCKNQRYNISPSFKITCSNLECSRCKGH